MYVKRLVKQMVKALVITWMLVPHKAVSALGSMPVVVLFRIQMGTALVITWMLVPHREALVLV